MKRVRWPIGVLALGLFAGVAGACGEPLKEWAEWREKRLVAIGGTNGWATLAGLFWLRQGPNTVGFGGSYDVALPADSGRGALGILICSGRRCRWVGEPGIQVSSKRGRVTKKNLATDARGNPTVLETGRIRFWAIERGDRLGIRVKDPRTPQRQAFRGIDVYPYDARWRIRGGWKATGSAGKIQVLDVTGNQTKAKSLGVAEFDLNGKQARLTGWEDEDTGEVWFVFRDATAGKTTYKGGRFLHSARPGKGAKEITLDFNFAYNPPCAFTPYATCPLPPNENRLEEAVEAGERAPERGTELDR